MYARQHNDRQTILEESMADRNSNSGGRSDESRNPDLGRDEDSGMSGSRSGSTGSDRDSGLSDTSRDRGTSGDSSSGSESETDLGNDEIGDENVSSR
jgi:hypothetical protein